MHFFTCGAIFNFYYGLKRLKVYVCTRHLITLGGDAPIVVNNSSNQRNFLA